MKKESKKGILFLGVICVILIICCSVGFIKEKHKISAKENSTHTHVSVTSDNNEIMREKGKEYKGIYSNDDVVILVNGYEILRKDVEIQKTLAPLFNNITEKDIINDAIKNLVIKSEAERLGIKPQQNDIDKYMEQMQNAFDNNYEGMDLLISYLESAGITLEDYMISLKVSAYNIFQRDELRKYVDSKNLDYDKYIEDLINGADIQFNDEILEEIYKR